MNQKNKIAIVTGAGSGIGRATAIALSNNHWLVVLTGRSEQKLLETAQLSKPGQTHVKAADITNQKSVKNLFSSALIEFGRVDLLFNNAGISTTPKPLEEVTLEEWQMVISTNLTGSFLCTQEAFRIMKTQNPMGGRIINNGSISAHVPRPNSVAYTVSKHAITGLTKATSLDGRQFNIACGQIDIGNAASKMTTQMEKGILQADGSIKVEPTINVKDVANAVVYMAGLSLGTNVPFITVMANGMPYIGRG